MISAFLNTVKIPELRRRIFFTLAIIVIVRLGAAIVVIEALIHAQRRQIEGPDAEVFRQIDLHFQFRRVGLPTAHGRSGRDIETHFGDARGPRDAKVGIDVSPDRNGERTIDVRASQGHHDGFRRLLGAHVVDDIQAQLREAAGISRIIFGLQARVGRHRPIVALEIAVQLVNRRRELPAVDVR